jgi:hypothetical protein
VPNEIPQTTNRVVGFVHSHRSPVALYWTGYAVPNGQLTSHRLVPARPLIRQLLSIRTRGSRPCATCHSALDSVAKAIQPPHSANRHDVGCDGVGRNRVRVKMASGLSHQE